jgi:hypothetical protein
MKVSELKGIILPQRDEETDRQNTCSTENKVVIAIHQDPPDVRKLERDTYILLALISKPHAIRAAPIRLLPK